jgi:hypothetical protein
VASKHSQVRGALLRSPASPLLLLR